MISPCESFISPASKLSCSPAATRFDYALHQCVKNFKDLLLEYERVLTDLENSKNEVSKLKALCESKSCNSAEDLQKAIVNKDRDIATKDNIISLIASTITQLNKTRDWSYIDTISLLFDETTKTSPAKENPQTDISHETNNVSAKTRPVTLTYDLGTPKKTKNTLSTPKKATNAFSTPKKGIKKEKITPTNETKQPSPKLANLSLKLEKKSPELGKKSQEVEKKSQELEKKSPELEEIREKSTDPCSSIEDISFKEESLSEIDVTPRAKSPIFQSKKGRIYATTSLLSNNTSDTDVREKKKCPDSWTRSPAKKHLVSYLNPKKKSPCRGGKGRKLVQRRFIRDSFVRDSNVVDLTSSPDCSMEGAVKRLIKKESSENDETILPSPTSKPSEFIATKNVKEKEIPLKLKPKNLFLKHKTEPMDCNDDQIGSKIQPTDSKLQPTDSKIEPITCKIPPVDLESHSNVSKLHQKDPKDHTVESKVHPTEEKSQIVSFGEPKVGKEAHNLENSVNILNPNRCESPIKSQSTLDQLQPMDIAEPDYDLTKCDTLLNICDPETDFKENVGDHNTSLVIRFVSPTKHPLAENKNIPNAADSSMSLLGGNKGKELDHPPKSYRKTPEKVEPVYKEPTVRKKAEKMALPAWLCDECKAFINALYDDPDPAKVQEIISTCGKHRGRNNPARPATPPGYWAPRWSVASDTDQFNRDNNA